MQTRKQFLLNTLTVASGTALFGYNTFGGSASRPTPPPALTFDLHCHPGRLSATGKSGFGDAITPDKTVGEMNGVQLSGAFFALVADANLLELGPAGVSIKGTYKPGEGWAVYKKQLTDLTDFFQRATVRKATRSGDLKQSGSVAAYIAVEGGDFLGGQIEKLDEAYTDGVRSVQLVHYAPNDLGDLQTAPAVHNGLSSFGKEVVRKMNKLGMVIDVAHASYQTTKDVASLTDSPIMLSHSILEMEPDRPIAKRAISKEHAKVVAQTGGLIGVWPSGFNKSFDEFVDNTRRMVDVIGIDRVGIGTDMDGNFKPVLASYSQYPTFADALKNKGLSTSEVEKIMGGNAARLLARLLKK